MGNTLTVAVAIAQFEASPEFSGQPDLVRFVMRQAFIDGLWSGLSLAVRAFEESHASEDLSQRLYTLYDEIDAIDPSQRLCDDAANDPV